VWPGAEAEFRGLCGGVAQAALEQALGRDVEGRAPTGAAAEPARAVDARGRQLDAITGGEVGGRCRAVGQPRRGLAADHAPVAVGLGGEDGGAEAEGE
jgi:hypothetical protein